MSKRYGFFIGLFLVIIAGLIGCGTGGSGGGGGDLGQHGMLMDLGGTVSGVVYDSGIVTSIRPSILPATAQGRPLVGARVFIEEFPQFAATTDGEGAFVFYNVPPDVPLHVVVKYTSLVDGKIYRERSAPLALARSQASSEVKLGVRKADQTLVIVAKDSSENPIPFAKVTVWGETFTADSQGKVVLTMPAGRSEVVIANSGYTEVKQVIEFGSQSQGQLEVGLLAGGSNRSPQVGVSAHTETKVPTGGMLRCAATANDYDGDRMTFEWSATSGTFSGATNTPVIEWIAPDYATIASITVTAKDGKGGWAKAALSVVVGGSGTNNHPVVAIIAGSSAVYFKEVVTMTASGTDPDGDSLTYAWSATHGTFSASSGMTVDWIAPEATVSAVITLTAVDGKSGIGKGQHGVTVTRYNYLPTVTLYATTTTPLAASPLQILATGADQNGDTLTYTWSVGKGTITASGATAMWTPPAEVTQASVTCLVDDGYGGIASASQMFTVSNNFPQLSLVPTAASAQPGESISITANASDQDGDTITYAWSATKGTLSATTGTTVTWQSPNEVTTATVTCTISDGRGGSATSSLTFIVDSNRSPTASVTASEYTTIQGIGISVTCSATDPNNDLLTYSWSADNGSFAAANSAITTWTAGNGPTTAALQCYVSDGRGGSTTVSLSISILEGKTLSVGEHYTWTVNNDITFNLGTPNQNERFGLIFYPLNTTSATYNFKVNGGGEDLPEMAPQPLTEVEKKFAGQRKVDQYLRQREQIEASLSRNSIQYSPAMPPVAVEAVNVGEDQDFKIIDMSDYSVKTRTFSLRVVGSKCKVFRDKASATDSEGRTFDPAGTDDATLQSFATDFDNKIYDFIETNYGRVWDKNGDTKVTILFSPIVNAGSYGTVGFFFSGDFSDNDSYSNKRDVFYMCVYDSDFWGSQGINGYKSYIPQTLVHEFQHMVNYCEHAHYNSGDGEESWLNEGLSVEAQVRYSNDRDERIDYYASMTELVSITNWNQNLANYGGDGLFLRYVYERVGTDTIKAMVSTALEGTANMDSACSAKGGFAGMFKNWAVALFRWNKNLPANAEYDYQFPINISLSAQTEAKKYTDAYSGSQVSTSLRFVQIDPPPGYSSKYTSIRVQETNSGKFGVTVLRMKDP